MTNNEAIRILAIVVETAKGRCFVTDEAISDAYAMAISALEAQELSNNSPKLDSGNGEFATDVISRQAAIDALEKCYTCKHVYQRVSDADTLYCRCRKGCKYEEFKPKRSGENPRRHEG